VRDRPTGVTERDLVHALADGWGVLAADLRYAPVGGGSYHWVVRDDQGERRFVTVDDLDGKGWLGRSRAAVFEGLRAAMDAAVTLRRDAALGFVVAPIPALDGQTLRPLGARHAVAMFPFLRGAAGRFGEIISASQREELVVMLAALHRANPAAVRLPRCEIGLSWRGDLEAALHELGRSWRGGPFAEPARALLAGAAGSIRRRLETLDRWASDAAAAGETVITHGEPHPGNVIRAGREIMLIDWDTVGWAPPERDLWMVASAAGDELRRYTELTGRPVDATALKLYRLRWALDDISCFVRDLRVPHRRTAGTEHAWQSLEQSIAQVTRWPLVDAPPRPGPSRVRASKIGS
jgi:spectinomycin phosphotransferase